MRTVLDSFLRVWTALGTDFRTRSVFLVLWMIVGATVELLGVGLIVPVLAIVSEPDWAGKHPTTADLLARTGITTREGAAMAALAALVLAYLTKTIVIGWLSHLQAKLVFDVERRFSTLLFTSYLSREWSFHLNHNSSELIRNVRSETGTCSYVMMAMLNLVADSIVVTALVGLMLVVEPLAAIATGFLALGFGAAFQVALRPRLARWGDVRQFYDELRFRHLQQGLGAIREVQLLNKQRHFVEQFDSSTRQQLHAFQRQTLVQQFPRLGLELLAVSAMSLVVGVMIARGRTLGELVPTLAMFAAASMKILPCASKIIGSISMIQYAAPSVRIVQQEIAAATPQSEQDGQRTAAEPPSGPIALCNVRFRYPDAHRDAVSGISLEIPLGAMVGFIGTSGSGKSTLMDLLLGLLKPSEGTIRVGGVDIQSCIRGWQSQVGYVPQTIFLTDESLRRNIAFGEQDDAIDDRRIRRAIQDAQLTAFIDSLPAGLDTAVGERGVRLSGGQRQRIGIARALYHEPTVLVLDEATSALDGPTEREFMDAVRSLQGTKTIIIVAHRLSTVEQCDTIWRLEAGSVAASGAYPDVTQSH